MNFIATNTRIGEELRGQYQCLLYALPTTSLAIAIFIIPFVLNDLLMLLGLPSHHGIKSQEQIFLLAMFIVMTSIIAVGYLVGWLLNVICFRKIMHWSYSSIWQLMAYSNVPKHWLNTNSRYNPDKKTPSKAWQKARANGKWRYITSTGMLFSSSIIFILFVVLPDLRHDNFSSVAEYVVMALACLCAGTFYGLITWFVFEKRYQRLSHQQLSKKHSHIPPSFHSFDTSTFSKAKLHD
ncbi:hypothetical protein [Thalassotalea sp. PLHSN55]|uniref:hypothetical protein n=1 Tax=Thalassotalea sp. PLHSN55 TaxID=3435888 RepID=UPI003F87748F